MPAGRKFRRLPPFYGAFFVGIFYGIFYEVFLHSGFFYMLAFNPIYI